MIAKDLYRELFEILSGADEKSIFREITDAMRKLQMQRGIAPTELISIQSWDAKIDIKSKEALLYMIRAQQLYRTQFFDEGQKYESLALKYYLTERSKKTDTQKFDMPDFIQSISTVNKKERERIQVLVDKIKRENPEMVAKALEDQKQENEAREQASLKAKTDVDIFEKTRLAHNIAIVTNKPTRRNRMSKENEGIGCLLLIVLLVIGGVWAYDAFQKAETVEQFNSHHYQTHIVQRVSKGTNNDWFSGGKSELIILMENGDIVKESQFTDNASALTQVGDALDIVYNKDGTIEGVRRTIIAPQ